MRLQLAQDLKTRTGVPDKDARIKNGIVEVKGGAAVVRSRPGVSEALDRGLGLFAQGGMMFGDYLVFMNDDVVFVFSSSFSVLNIQDLSTGSPLFGSWFDYELGDIVYFPDEDTGVYEPWYPYARNPSHPPSKNTLNPGYWLWGKEAPTANWQWATLPGGGVPVAVVSGFGSCAAATQGYIGVNINQSGSMSYFCSGCRTYDGYVKGFEGDPAYRVGFTLGVFVQVTSTPL